MTAVSIVARRCVTVGGPTDTIYFCANVYSEGTPQTLLGSSAFLQARRLPPEFLRLPRIPHLSSY